jgi:hypothetical protein
MTDLPIPVLYIGGYGRSGTTLIERVLGQLPGLCAVGEMRHVWERSFRDNQLCGCGQPFRVCEFWSAVVRRAFGGFDRLDAGHMVDQARRVDRTRYVPRLLAPGGAFAHRFADHAAVVRRLYGAIREVSGCRVIVDSSKEPSYGWLLQRAGGFEVSVVHVVRDSRAVAFSWVRKKERPEVHWRRELMDVHAPLKSAALWLTFNALCRAMARLGCAYRRVHYEDFVVDPVAALTPVLAMIGESPAALDWVDGRRLHLAANHTVSGNPMRFAVGDVEVQLDREWRDRMRPADRRLMTALTFPSLLRYGYLGGRRDLGAARPAPSIGALRRDGGR